MPEPLNEARLRLSAAAVVTGTQPQGLNVGQKVSEMQLPEPSISNVLRSTVAAHVL